MSQAATTVRRRDPRPGRISARALRIGLGSLLALAALASLTALVVSELRSSTLQARLLAPAAQRMQFRVEAGPSPVLHFPRTGPYDERLGYTRIPSFVERAEARGWRVEAQARPSRWLELATGAGLAAPYREKTRSGLQLFDRGGRPLFSALHPEGSYPDFDAIPPPVARSLLYVENRELLEGRPSRNPALEWDRLARAGLVYAFGSLGGLGRGPGGSTLATQMEKFRHSEGGVTSSAPEKLRQITGASLRAYRYGEDTRLARRELVTDFLNSMPLAARPGRGEIFGLAEGLEAWYGADFDAVNALLHEPPALGDPERLAAQARAYRQALSLILAARRPTTYLVTDPAALVARTEGYLRLLTSEGLLAPDFRDAALAQASAPSPSRGPHPPRHEGGKATDALRNRLVALLGLRDLYQLDRLDLSAETPVDLAVQDEVSRRLRELSDREQLAAAGLLGERLLERGDPSAVVYSFSLYEVGPDVNRLRVHTDNLDQPLDVNDGSKLDLGSTAKLRTLVTYLEVIAELHGSLSGRSPEDLRALEPAPFDALTKWVIERLLARPEISLAELLEEALDRRYSASPWEQFRTGGGLHTFANFDEQDDRRILSVREGLRRSVNLVYVRLMRDVVRWHVANLETFHRRILEDRDDPRRSPYLYRYAEREGREFLDRFLRKYRGKDADEVLDLLVEGRNPTPRHLAVMLRSLRPEWPLTRFSEELRARLPEHEIPETLAAQLYHAYGIERFDLADRGYLARVHPLELWLAGYLREHPRASRQEVLQASLAERLTVSRWLFSPRRKAAQDVRIWTILEMEAFAAIHERWARTGYPFDSLVPSFATAIGSSGDRPSALAELMGVLANDGVRRRTVRVERLRLAEGTPYETHLAPPSSSTRVLPVEVARAVRGVLADTVENGTARRAFGAFDAPGAPPVVIGGKTGTGDHRFKTFGAGGRLLDSKVMSRTATFVFLIDQRFYGVVSAHVQGPEAARYAFTSALPVQIFRNLAPTLRPLLDQPPPAGDLQVAGPTP
jgi:membrane peptidoglycan carboxypeptidase